MNAERSKGKPLYKNCDERGRSTRYCLKEVKFQVPNEDVIRYIDFFSMFVTSMDLQIPCQNILLLLYI